MMDILGKIMIVLGCILTYVFVIKFLSGDFEKRRKLKIGQRVAVRFFSLDNNREEFKAGKIVATRPRVEGAYWELLYAVRLDDGKIGLFSARQLFTEWGEDS